MLYKPRHDKGQHSLHHVLCKCSAFLLRKVSPELGLLVQRVEQRGTLACDLGRVVSQTHNLAEFDACLRLSGAVAIDARQHITHALQVAAEHR